MARFESTIPTNHLMVDLPPTLFPSKPNPNLVASQNLQKTKISAFTKQHIYSTCTIASHLPPPINTTLDILFQTTLPNNRHIQPSTSTQRRNPPYYPQTNHTHTRSMGNATLF